MILLRNVPNSCEFGHRASAGTRQDSACPNEQLELQNREVRFGILPAFRKHSIICVAWVADG